MQRDAASGREDHEDSAHAMQWTEGGEHDSGN
jgi:hypothetical protein